MLLDCTGWFGVKAVVVVVVVVVVATDARCVLRNHSYVRTVVCLLGIVRKPCVTALRKFAKVLLDQHYLNLYAVLRFTHANYAVDFLFCFCFRLYIIC